MSNTLLACSLQDLRRGSTFLLDRTGTQKQEFKLSDEIPDEDSDESEDGEDAIVDFDSAEFNEDVKGAAKALMSTSNCTR